LPIAQLVLLQDSEPFGICHEKWTEKWWRWVLATPKPSNPALDIDGRHCARNQTDPNVWFLAGTMGGSARRICTIPSAKAILIPIINDEQSFAEKPDFKSDLELESLVKSEVDGVIEMTATIDSIQLSDLEKCRVQTRPFDVTFPEDNIWGVKAGPTRAAADGYWLFLRPLSKGKHTIHIYGRGAHFENEVTYDLMVVDRL
jgi:hypothetical protein